MTVSFPETPLRFLLLLPTSESTLFLSLLREYYSTKINNKNSTKINNKIKPKGNDTKQTNIRKSQRKRMR